VWVIANPHKENSMHGHDSNWLDGYTVIDFRSAPKNLPQPIPPPIMMDTPFCLPEVKNTPGAIKDKAIADIRKWLDMTLTDGPISQEELNRIDAMVSYIITTMACRLNALPKD
jgi:hypothetical protein